jgi:hypothetical protein
MSTFNQYKTGVGHVGSYQVSGIPFMKGGTLLTGATDTITFPTVARSVTVIATVADIKVHFANTGDWDASKHFITLTAGGDNAKMTFIVKCKELFITDVLGGSSYEVFAELTSIATDEMFALTGPGLDD